jgi:LmbE family N-acetylglucosaminyl deacetylase
MFFDTQLLMSRLTRILFIAPHADDIEVLCASTCQAAVDLGWEVHQNLSCADEYGTDRVDFRGRRLARIRKAEMAKVARTYGVDAADQARVHLHWMHYIDGHVPFSRESVRSYKKFILDLSPDIICGPDPFFTIDRHTDHMAVGRNYYFALKSMIPNQRPKIMLFYQSYLNNYFIRFSAWKRTLHLQMGHRSQFHPVLMKIFGVAGWFFWHRSVNCAWREADKYRRVTFDPEAHQIKLSWKDPGFILKHLFFTYLARFGQPPPGYYQKPPVAEILRDYAVRGWV